MTKLYHGPAGQGWQVPGEQDRKAARVDVPNSPGDLASWLNARRVPREQLTDEQLVASILSHNDEPPPQLASDGVVITEAEAAKVNASRPPFLPRLSAEEIEARRMAEGKCPKCGGGLPRDPEVARIELWMELAELEEIQRIVERAREIVRGRGAQLTGEGRAN